MTKRADFLAVALETTIILPFTIGAVSSVVERLVYTQFWPFFAIFALRLVDQHETVLR
jgi:hypothetical protein